MISHDRFAPVYEALGIGHDVQAGIGGIVVPQYFEMTRGALDGDVYAGEGYDSGQVTSPHQIELGGFPQTTNHDEDHVGADSRAYVNDVLAENKRLSAAAKAEEAAKSNDTSSKDGGKGGRK